MQTHALWCQRGGPSIELDLPRTLTQVRLVGYPDKDVSLQVLGPGHAELADTGVFRGQASCSIVLREDVCLQLSDDEGKPLAQLWLHAAFLDQPHLVCDRHWLDLERKNKKSKALKKATVEFLFADDGSFVSPGRCGTQALSWPQRKRTCCPRRSAFRVNNIMPWRRSRL